MARPTVSARFDEAALKRIIEKLAGHPARELVARRLEEKADAILENARAEWPVLRSATSGLPLEGEAYAKATRGHDDPKHSRELLYRKTEQHPLSVRVTIYSAAGWAYKIRTRQLGLSEGQRIQMFKRLPGETPKLHRARRQISGTRRHAWTVLVRTPGKAANKAVAQTIGAELAALAERGS